MRARTSGDWEPKSVGYDYHLLTSRIRLFRKLRKQKDYDQLIFRLREELHGNIGNMANPFLYQKCRVGTKKLVNDYIDEISVYPEHHLSNIGKLFSNPNPEQIEKMIFERRKATWPQIERIRNTTRISRTLDYCLQRMSERFVYVER